MKRFLKSSSFKILVVIVAVILAGAVLASVSHNASTPVTSAISTIFSPLQSLSAIIADSLDDVEASFKSSTYYRLQNIELEKELEEYRKKLADYDEMKKRVEAYENFYGIKQKNEDYKFSYASVISKDAADAYDSFVLNTGSNDGVSVGDPVIYGEYVVGVVKKVNFSTCVVYSVLDPRVNVGAYESGSKEYGYVSGDAKLFSQKLCKLSGLSAGTSVVGGGIVCTSGAGGVFPGGLIIGEITAVKSDEVTSAYYAEIKPFMLPENISDVFVITDFEGQGEGEIKK